MKENKLEADRWQLYDLVNHDDISAAMTIARLEKAVKQVEEWRLKLTPNISENDFLALLKDYEAAIKERTKLNVFVELQVSADTQNEIALAFQARVKEICTQSYTRLLFVFLWWKNLDETNATRLLQISGDLQYYLKRTRQAKRHTLSEAEEKIIALKDMTGAQAMENLYDVITNGFEFKLIIDSEEKILTRDTISRRYTRHPDPELRIAAYQELHRVFAEHSLVLGQIYSYIVRDWHNECLNLRRYETPIAVRNFANDIPDAAVETLLQVITANSHVFQRYFRLKAKMLGMDKLQRYHLYAPLISNGQEKKYNLATATQMVMETFCGFSPLIYQLAKKVFKEKHVDSEIRPGKCSGAFCCSTIPELTPWVLLNYNGTANDVATMAHELGHAVHAMLANDHSVFNFHAPLPLAETASVFAEMLQTEKLLATETDLSARRQLLAETIDDIYATVHRQGFFALWEKEAHQLIIEGKTTNELADHYLANLKTQFGDAVEVSDEFRWEWTSISHFYATPFYVYAYAFGQLLTLSLYQIFKREGESFKDKYLKFLSYGGSASPVTILQEIGIDITSAEFWQNGYDIVAGLVDQLEKMCE